MPQRTMSTERTAETTLAAGQCLHVALDAGTVLLASRGRVCIDEAPRWLAGAMLPARQLLCEGQAHAVARPGWVRVTALDAAGACVRTLPVAEPVRGSGLPRFVRAWLRA